MRPILLLASVFLGSSLFLGCVEGAPTPGGERLGNEGAPIINGSPDVTHAAVVAVLSPDFECTGTVLQVKGTTGYVLTAGHCCPANDLPTEVVVGPDYNTGVSHAIVSGSITKDSCYLDYPGSTDDICLLKFKNAAGTPTIPAMTPQTDALAAGTAITYVGYGITAAPPGGGNSLRRKVAKTIGSVDSYFVEYASPGASGTCEGDSGGPGLVVVNGQEMVASVTSYGDNDCSQLGASIRASAVYDKVIAPYLADQAPSPICPVTFDCQICNDDATQHNGCKDITKSCFADTACTALVTCYQSCSTQACVNACNTANVGGLTKYAAIETCVCTTACAPACGADLQCTAPKCGLKVTDPSCASCVESTCCAEAWECQADATCKKCFGANPPAACATSPKAAAYYQCAKSKCSCAVTDPASVGGTTAASSSAASTGSGEVTTATTGAGGADPSVTAATGAGVGGAGAVTAAGAGGADAAGGSGSTSGQAGGCACATQGAAEHGSSAPFAALGLGLLGVVARRRRHRA